jgi:hypothetical protein
MSLVLQSSGGGQITVQEPTTASNFTQTLPAASGEVMVSGNQPAFSAAANSSQSLTANTATKLLFAIEEFDTNNNFASSRFTPTVAGYYQINAAYVAASIGRTYSVIYLYKNGIEYKIGQAGNNTVGIGTSFSVLVYLNGSTDYVEIYALNGLTQSTSGTSSENYFQGVLVRAA